MFPTGMFATATQRKILRVLSEKNRRYTIAELAELCHRSKATISRSLRHADRFPFIERGRVRGSKQLTFRLDPESRYTAGIRTIFEEELARERQNGTVPVAVWNLLEDVTDRFEDDVEGFVELFLFGSYATGEYYAGSDIDLLLVSTGTGDVTAVIDRVEQSVDDERLQVIPVQVPAGTTLADEELLELVVDRSPAGGRDVLIPLTGEVST